MIKVFSLTSVKHVTHVISRLDYEYLRKFSFDESCMAGKRIDDTSFKKSFNYKNIFPVIKFLDLPTSSRYIFQFLLHLF